MKIDSNRRRTKNIKIRYREDFRIIKEMNSKRRTKPNFFTHQTFPGKRINDVCYKDKGIECSLDADLEDSREDVKNNVNCNVITKQLLDIDIPKGFLCDDCAKIGVYTRDDRVKRAINLSKNSSIQEQCSICRTFFDPRATKEQIQENVLMSVLYSHDFYDKFSRDKRPIFNTESSESILDKEKETHNINKIKLMNSEKEQSSGKEEIRLTDTPEEEDLQHLRPEKTAVDQTNLNDHKANESEQKTQSSVEKLPQLISKVSIMDHTECDPQTQTFTTFHNENIGERRRSSSVQIQNIEPPTMESENTRNDSPRAYVLAATRKHSEYFSSLYQKRAIKGSTIRKDMFGKTEKNCQQQERYSVESLGLTFGIPEFNLRLAGRTIKRPSVTPRRPNSHRSNYSSSSNPHNFLPPLNSSYKNTFSLGTI